MKIGISALLFNLEECLEICEDIEEINHLEIGIDNLSDCDEFLKYKSSLEKLGLSIGVHLPMELNACENIEYIRNQWIEYIKQVDEKLMDLKIEYYNLHLGYVISSRLNNNRNKYLDNCIKFLEKLDLERNVKILIENTYSKKGDFSNVGTICRDFEYIFNKIKLDKYWFCYDTGHNLINSDNYIERLRDKVEVVHLSDNDGVEDIHAGIGKGILEISEIKNILKLKPNYLVMEIRYNHIEDSIDRVKLIMKEV